MRIFYENLIESVENYYNNKSTFENVLHLEDIVKNITTELYVQYKYKSASDISYLQSNIEISGIVKCRNHLFFINNYRTVYNNFISLENNTENKIRIKIVNADISGSNPYKIAIYNNNNLVEELEYDDEYKLYNNKNIQLYSESMGTYINITQPLYLDVNEYVEYDVYTIYATEEPAVHKYLCSFDKINNAIVFNKKYQNEEINVLLKTYGSILRSSTINDLYRVNAQSFVQYDESSNKLLITEPKLYKDGSKLKYINSQNVIIDPAQLNIGYSLLGIYIDSNNNLLYDSILNETNYALLVDKISDYSLDNIRKERTYYGFIIGINNITTFTPTDIQLYDTGAGGSGGGSSSIEKITEDFTNIEELVITYENSIPSIIIYDDNGNQIIPENIHYNMLDTVTITFGEYLTGKVMII